MPLPLTRRQMRTAPLFEVGPWLFEYSEGGITRQLAAYHQGRPDEPASQTEDMALYYAVARRLGAPGRAIPWYSETYDAWLLKWGLPAWRRR